MKLKLKERGIYRCLRKNFLVMRITLLLMLLSSAFAFSSNSYAQNAKLSLRLNNVTVSEALKAIEAQSEFIFFYQDQQVDLNRKVIIAAEDKSVNEILDQLFKGSANVYTIRDRQIIIGKSQQQLESKELSFERIFEEIQQPQKKEVKGKVTDEQGLALPGATITIEGTTRGVITDNDGTFRLEVVPGNKLVISFIGFTNQVITYTGQTDIKVNLKDKSLELDNVTVVAFAKQKKESVLASISTIDTRELKIPSSNLTTALAGRIAGLISYQRSGEPGADDASFFVRGVTSFSYARGPMILIDGVEMTSADLARMQPDDIASFSIMKDATATALYGARGANGVILVTTKEGQEGPAKISVRYETSISQPTQDIQMADPITYMNLNNEAVLTRNKLGVAPYSLEKIEKTMAGSNPLVYPANDWRSLLIKDNTLNHRLNFNLSGGGKIARYYIAGTFNQDNGILKVDKKNNFNNNIDLKRYLLHSNVNINVTNTTEVIARLHGTFDDYSGPLDSGTDLYKKILRSDPVSFPAYYQPDVNTQNTRHILFGNFDTGNYINPYADMVKGYKEYTKTTILAQFEVKQNLDFITNGLKARALFSTTRYSFFDLSRSYNPFYYAVDTYDKMTNEYLLKRLNPTTGTEYLNYAPGAKNITSSSYGELVFNYDKSYGKNHNVSGLLVFTARNSLNANAETLSLSLPERNMGISGRLTYNYNTRYFAEFNFGYNGSERFAKNERFGFFPSAGLGWILSNEKFWGDNLKKTITMLKLKGTYGLVGNDAIGDQSKRFFYLSEVNMNNSNYGYTFGDTFGYTVNGISISQYPNEFITWEKSTKMNLGVEAKLFDLMNINAEYYTEERTGILMARSFIPATMGLMATPQSNLGVARASGVDVSLDVQKSFSKDFWLSSRVNFTYSTSKYVKYEDVNRSLTPWLSRIGQPISQQWGYIAERLFVDDNEVANSPTQFGVYGAGDIKYRDINDDGIINTDDQVPIGYPTEPNLIYGFGFSTGYKGFDFSCFFQGLGRETFWIDANRTAPFIDSQTDDERKKDPRISKNALLKAYADNHWSEDNRNIYALWPRLSDKAVSNNTQRSTWFMRDGSFLRLKSTEFGYTLPKNLLARAYIKNCRVYFSGTNLLTFSKFKLWDPEMAGNGLAYPVQQVYNFGVQLSF